MNKPNDHFELSNAKDFWDSLQMDLLTSSQRFQKEDYLCFIERSFIYSLLFRGCHPIEQVGLVRLLNIKAYGYVIIMDFSSVLRNSSDETTYDEIEISHYIKSLYLDKNMILGPMVINRMCLLISYDTLYLNPSHKNESISFCKSLREEIYNHFNIQVSIGIGSQQNINTIYTSFIDSLSSLHLEATDNISYYEDIQNSLQNTRFDYSLTEKHMLEAIRLRKPEAYDYFELIMHRIKPLSDELKRNKIVELLVLSNHAISLDSMEDTRGCSYTSYVVDIMKLSGELLHEYAYRSFISIVRYVKTQSNIDYSNHIVMTTQEYLELHFAEDISLEDVAEQVNISPQYFSKLIKKTTGFNFIDWLSMLRVKKAKELLTNSNYTVKEVCFMVGYKDPNYFSRIFKKRIGITPSEYVKTSPYLNNKNSSNC
jgi:two-component system response regulator YesN